MPETSQPQAPRSFLRRLAFFFVGGYVLFSLIVGLGFTFKQATRRFGRVVLSVPSDLVERAEPVEFRTADGYRISGLIADPVGPAPVLIIQHGRGRNRDDVLPWGQVFARAGYGVLSFDWRGHGDSDGNTIQHGGGEPNDLAAALEFLSRRPGTAGRPVGLVGFSLGAACLAMSAPRLPDGVKCMVLDSPFGDLGRMASGRLAPLGLARFGPRLVLDGVALVLFGATTAGLQPEKNLAAFSPRPVFWMHGAMDKVVPVSEGRSLAAAYPGPMKAWETPETRHCKSRTTRTPEWMKHVASFFAEHLEGAPTAASVLERTPKTIVEGFKIYSKRRKENS